MSERINLKMPMDRFRQWLREAEESEPNEPNAMCLTTVGETGMPSARMVLLKGVDERGFVFFTNLESRKGRELRRHPKAALLFHWKSRGRQVRVEGEVESVTEEEADAYFATRPRQSQLGAWASKQSEPLAGRFELEGRVARFAAKYAIGSVPRPEFWSGFRVLPLRFEFWEEGAFRMHERLVFRREGEAWLSERLYP